MLQRFLLKHGPIFIAVTINFFTSSINMKSIKGILDSIAQRQDCVLHPIVDGEKRKLNSSLPQDLKEFYEMCDGLTIKFKNGKDLEIVSVSDFRITNEVLYPPGDVIWEELEDDISNEWYLLAKSEELSQYVSIDLNIIRAGRCYDSYLDIHANPGDSPVIAKSFTELLVRLWTGKDWYWTEDEFSSHGDAYDEN